jgi:hypothetical protein
MGSMWGLRWTKRHWGRFSPRTSVSPANHSTDFSIIIITRGWHNRPLRRLWLTLILTPTMQIKKKNFVRISGYFVLLILYHCDEIYEIWPRFIGWNKFLVPSSNMYACGGPYFNINIKFLQLQFQKKAYKFPINRRKDQLDNTSLTEWRSMNREMKPRNYSKYIAKIKYLQNQDVYTEQEEIPFSHSKCRSALYVILQLPCKLAQTLTLLTCIGRSPLILRGVLWYSSASPMELRDIFLNYVTSQLTSYPVRLVHFKTPSVS